MLNKILGRLRKSSALKPLSLFKIAEKDVTQSVLDELLNTKAKLRATYRSSFDALTLANESGFIDCNTAALTLFGCANVDELCRYQPSELSPAIQRCGTDSKSLAQHYMNLTIQNGSCHFEWRHQRADNGVLFDVDILLSSLKIGDITVVQAVLHDLTARKKALAILKREKSQLEIFALALEQCQSAVLITDRNTHIEYVNQAFVDHSGYTREEIIGSKTSRFKSGKTPISTFQSMWASLNNGKAWKGEITNRNKQGQAFIELTWITPILRDDGSISHYLSVKEDITEHKKKNALLLAAKEKAENLAKTKAQFLANMSHEIRTPMAAIIGFSDLALLNEMPQETYGYLQDINTASNHLMAILNDILDTSKLEAGQMTLQLECFNLADIRATLQSLLINTAEKKGLTLIIEIASKVPDTLIGDHLRLRQVLINLLGNAIKFTQQGEVRLSVSVQQRDANEARLLFAVTDTGMGISAEQQDKLFQPFAQVDDGSTRNFGGTGLGLVISQELVQLMGGSIKLDSHVGIGSCFSFELLLPLAEAAIESNDLPTISLNPEPLKGVRFLIAEDDNFNQKIITKVLKNFGAASIVLANNGLEALAALEQDSFDMVLMDLHMPCMDGTEATLEIRKQARYAQLPIITLSAGVTEEEFRKSVASGMNDFVAKPINKQELLATLERWLKP